MKSKFEYIIDRDDNKKITGRSVQITITASTLEDAEKALSHFEIYLKLNTNNNYHFSGCPWEWKAKNNNWQYGDTIVVDDKEEAEEIKKYYKKWK